MRKFSDQQVIKVIADNVELKEALKDKDLPQTMRLNVDIDEKFSAPVVLHLPPNYDASARFGTLFCRQKYFRQRLKCDLYSLVQFN